MKKINRKLALNKQTIRELRDYGAVHGGEGRPPGSDQRCRTLWINDTCESCVTVNISCNVACTGTVTCDGCTLGTF